MNLILTFRKYANCLHNSIFHTCKLFTRHGLTLVGTDRALLQNGVTVVFNCYDVVSPIPGFCKSDINECNCVEKFVSIYILELLL